MAWDRDRLDQLERLGVDHEHARAVVLVGIDSPVERIVRDRIDRAAYVDVVDDLQGDRVDLADHVVAAARERVPTNRIERDAVNGPDAHLTDDLAGIGVEHQESVRAGVSGVNSPVLRIDGDVVETGVDRDGLRGSGRDQHYVVSSGRS